MVGGKLPCVSIAGTSKSRKPRSKMTQNRIISPEVNLKPDREREIEGQRAIAEVLRASCAGNIQTLTIPSGYGKLKKLFGRTTLVFLTLYGTFSLLWVLEIHFKCRVPYSEKSESISFFSGQNHILEFSKTEPEFLTYTPGLACLPYDSFLSTLGNLREGVTSCIKGLLESIAPISMGLI